MFESCHRNADQFFCLASKSLGELNLIHAVFCNFAFSCELYFKSLLYIEQKSIRGHEFVKLFNKLNENHKQEICSNCFKGDISKERFYLQLEESNKSFEVIRYVHEYKSMVINILFIFQLAGCLRMICSRYVK